MMKVLSLHQPWASLVVHGIKTFETRSWHTRYRGHLLIHSTKSRNHLKLIYTPVFQEAIGDLEIEFPRGVILGSVDMRECQPHSQLLSDLVSNDHPFEIFLGDWSPGRFMWELHDPEVWKKPIRARGHQRIWNWDLDA